MNTRNQLLALALRALTVSTSFAQSGEIGFPDNKPFQSTRTRAEVRAEAVEAAKAPNNGQFEFPVAAPVASTLTRAEVRIATVQANKSHSIKYVE